MYSGMSKGQRGSLPSIGAVGGESVTAGAVGVEAVTVESVIVASNSEVVRVEIVVVVGAVTVGGIKVGIPVGISESSQPAELGQSQT